MSTYGFPWPSMLDCNKFPVDNDMCITAQSERQQQQQQEQQQQQRQHHSGRGRTTVTGGGGGSGTASSGAQKRKKGKEDVTRITIHDAISLFEYFKCMATHRHRQNFSRGKDFFLQVGGLPKTTGRGGLFLKFRVRVGRG